MLAAFINSFVNSLAKVQVLDKTTGVAPAALQTCLYPGAATSQLLQAQQLREKKSQFLPILLQKELETTVIFHLNFQPSLSAVEASVSHCTAGPTQQLFLTYSYFSSPDTGSKIAPNLILRQAPCCCCSSN